MSTRTWSCRALSTWSLTGYQLTPHFGSWVTLGTILAKKSDAEENMFRFQIAYSF